MTGGSAGGGGQETVPVGDSEPAVPGDTAGTPIAPPTIPVQGPVQQAERTRRSSVDAGRVAEIRALIRGLEPELAEAAQETAALLDEVEALKAREEQLHAQLIATAERYVQQQEDLAAAVGVHYRYGAAELLELLLSAESFAELIARGEYLVVQMESTARLIREVETTRRQLESEKAQLDSVIAETEDKWTKALAQEQHLKSMRAAYLAQLN